MPVFFIFFIYLFLPLTVAIWLYNNKTPTSPWYSLTGKSFGKAYNKIDKALAKMQWSLLYLLKDILKFKFPIHLKVTH